MVQKPTKIVDVKRPEKVAPGTSSRPILVTNRPVLTNDPMMIVNDQPTADAEKPGEVINRTAKTIKPMDEDLVSKPEVAAATEKPAEASTAESTTEVEAKPADDTAPTTPAPSLDAKPEPAEDVVATNDEPKRDSEAEVNAEELAAAEAKAAREEQLEMLIASGKYNVPINAAQRKRSRMYTMLLCLLAVVLALLLFDAALDTGLVKLSVKMPHTHFFSAT